MPVYLRTGPTQLWFQSVCDECGRTIHEGEMVTIATRLRSITDAMEYSIYCYPPCRVFTPKYWRESAVLFMEGLEQEHD
jgi:hypothetical protein